LTATRTTNKGQLEIMGLAIVVLLISLAFLFVIQFTITNSKEEPQQLFARKQLAHNTLSTMVSTTTACLDLTVKDLIQDCMDIIQEYDCNDDGRPDSCATAEEVITTILDQTLKEWQKNYFFYIQLGQNEEMQIQNGECPGSKDQGVAFIPTRGGRSQITATLEVC